jgi:hypothetical protein
MLAKSKKSAFVMGSIFVLTTVVVSAVGDAVFLSEDPLIGQESERGAPFLSWLALAFVLLLAVGAMAVFAYEQGESHFGSQGAIRWAIAGVVYALLMQGVSLLLSRFEGQTFDGVVKNILQLVVIGLSYWVVFKVFAPKEMKRNEPTG